jgi:NAD(P)-dependent dehydrogenase (short-subunit alcohol dehydrogenase family)
MSSSANDKVAVVTGSSTGIGYETSLILSRNGFLTYATMRNLNKSENIKSVATKENLPIQIRQLDVTDEVSVTNAIQVISSEPFGIRVVIVEPGAIRTNFFDGLVVAKKSKDPNSPYSQIMQKVATGFEEMMKNASYPDLVAKVVLDAIRDKNPSLRYLAGSDVEAWLGGKRKVADEELYNMMKQNLMM